MKSLKLLNFLKPLAIALIFPTFAGAMEKTEGLVGANGTTIQYSNLTEQTVPEFYTRLSEDDQRILKLIRQYLPSEEVNAKLSKRKYEWPNNEDCDPEAVKVKAKEFFKRMLRESDFLYKVARRVIDMGAYRKADDSEYGQSSMELNFSDMICYKEILNLYSRCCIKNEEHALASREKPSPSENEDAGIVVFIEDAIDTMAEQLQRGCFKESNSDTAMTIAIKNHVRSSMIG